jgi:serine phosphatase RsbU (regulator of sigma subunit)/DNA-binding NarL/FixJ family response regulator
LILYPLASDLKEESMAETNPIRVMLVDDHAVVRSGLAAFLLAFDDLELVGEASSGEEALHLCEQIQPDLVLMDLVMPGMGGAAATLAIRERHPQIQVIALTSFKEKELVQAALAAGAIGYLLKNVSTDELADAIRAAHAGRSTLSPEAAQALVQAEKLERLARAIIDAPPDASTLPELLGEHVPSMFSHSRIEVQIYPDQSLLHYPADGPPVPDPIWEWLRTTSEAHYYLPGAVLPWGDVQPAGETLVIAPIVGVESRQPIGGIYILQHDGPDAAANLLPAVQSLVAQISSALHSAEVYAQTLAHERVARELALAAQMQASLLPKTLPDVTGWQLAARLEPARETSGDFYDFIPLPDGRLGILVADAADKGMGAALYMTLSRTLIRTYAAEYDARPDLVLAAANQRILMDTQAEMFVTVFYGILDPVSGRLTYCNAGHNPPFLLNAENQGPVQALSRTGLPLGVFEDAAWTQGAVQIAPGDMLLLYTDGITEAQDRQGAFFGEKRLLDVTQATLGHSAKEIQDALIRQVREFAGDAPQSDDITLMVVVRN